MRFSLPVRVEAALKAHCLLCLAGALVLWVGACAALAASLWYIHAAVRALPDHAAIRAAGSMVRATTIADVKGRHAFTIFEERRLQVPLARVSPVLVDAILAIEDRRFYDHRGIDPIRIAGAALHDLLKFRAEQGGSTITQQLARLSLLTPETTIRRKLQEAILARRLEQTFSKSEILELYLNKAYFGDGLYGVEAASLGYFGKHAAELSLPEAALIAGLVKSPSTYAPTVSPDRALARRQVVLGAMRRSGVLDQSAYESALRTPLRLTDALRREEAYGRYFKEEVRKQLVELFGWTRVHRDGLHVETTLDLEMQKAAEAEVARALTDIERRQARSRRARGNDQDLQAALVAIDPRSGEVRAMVGGRDFERSRYNRVTQARRQAGSAFKPFVYAAALEQGFTPSTLITGLNEPVTTSNGAWLPDDEHLEGDAITMRAALRTSSNRAAVRVLGEIGIPTAVNYVRQLGVETPPAVPSLALGSGEVTLLSLTSAFCAFANEGQLATPTLIRRVTTREGEVLYQAAGTARPAVTPTTAFLITSMLQDVVNAGTAARARQLGFRLPAAGKTGTTNDYRDAWFVGYTPKLVTGVWVGYDQPRTIVRGGYATELTVPLWARFMTVATRHDKAEQFRPPSTVIGVDLCPASGRLAREACHRDPEAKVYTEYFARGSQPLDPCDRHRPDVLRALLRELGIPVSARDGSVAADARHAHAEPSGDSDAASDTPSLPKKKRGFWARLFGKK
jgi:1A family penicillin-binding protein